MITALSLGAGVQSTALLLMALEGELELDCAVFADTGCEPEAVYRHVGRLRALAEIHDFPLYFVAHGDLIGDWVSLIHHGTRAASMPLFTKHPNGQRGILWRQCTQEYKIKPVRDKLRELADGTQEVELWMGITTDEAKRQKASQVSWIEHRYPLIEKRMSRHDCLNWLDAHGYDRPPKSACTICPFHSDARWLDLKQNDMAGWGQAVWFDALIRNHPKLEAECYLHPACVPLGEVGLGESQLNLFADMERECMGYCGV